MKQQVKEKPHCPYCGSDDVSFDATAEWDEETQQYELCSTFNSGGCRTCEQEFKYVDWKPNNETT